MLAANTIVALMVPSVVGAMPAASEFVRNLKGGAGSNLLPLPLASTNSMEVLCCAGKLP